MLTASDRAHIETDLLRASAKVLGRGNGPTDNINSWINAAVAAVGFARLATRLEAADAGATGSAALVAQGQAYVGFALAEPALFRLMFGGALARDGSKKSQEGGTAFAILADRVGTMTTTAARETISLHCWAIVHGLASLALDGLIDRDPAVLRRVVHDVLAVTVQGMVPSLR